MLERLKKYAVEHAWTLSALLGLVIAYYLLYARMIFNGEYTFGGDTHLYWSFKYLLFYSIKHFNTLPWWDPTEFNGFPLYFHLVVGWTNYLSPYTLPSLVLFKLLTSIFNTGINEYLIFHLTVYVFISNLLAVYLISNELSKNRAAVFFPPFLFTFSYFQLLNFHDFYVFEAMVAPLFFIYGLLYYNNRRTPAALLRMLFLTALLCASLQNGILMSAVFWTGLFVVLLGVMYRDIFRALLTDLRLLLATTRGRAVLLCLSVLILIGFVSAYLPFYLNAGDIVKYRNTVVELPGGRLHGISLPMDYNVKGGITNQPVPITNAEGWTALLSWLPFPDIHDNLLRFTWDSHEYRYIGLATIPLILAGLILVTNNLYPSIFFLLFFICNAFFVYADKNLSYKVMYDFSDMIRNVTNVSTILPRGGASLFLIFLSGMGLDALLSRRVSAAGAPGLDMVREERFFNRTTTFVIAGSLCLCMAGLLSGFYPGMDWMRHSFFHIGIYLLIFTFLCKMLFQLRSPRMTQALLLCLFLFAFLDLNVSSSAYLLNRHNFAPEDTSKHILIPYDKLEKAGKTLSDNLFFGPISNEAENMFPPTYMGVYHNVWMLMHGSKEWLYFASRPEGAKVLENYNQESFRMTAYPAFRFYAGASFIPFEAIADMDSSKQWYEGSPLFYLHDRSLVRPDQPPRPLPGRYMVTEFTPNTVSMKTAMQEQGFLYFMDNYDKFWSAYVDDVRVPIQRANFTFKAIGLPAGEHRVRWVYNPWPVKAAYGFFYTGIVISFFLRRWYDRRSIAG